LISSATSSISFGEGVGSPAALSPAVPSDFAAWVDTFGSQIAVLALPSGHTESS
jgi:hypothetical protein